MNFLIQTMHKNWNEYSFCAKVETNGKEEKRRKTRKNDRKIKQANRRQKQQTKRDRFALCMIYSFACNWNQWTVPVCLLTTCSTTTTKKVIRNNRAEKRKRVWERRNNRMTKIYNIYIEKKETKILLRVTNRNLFA